MLAHQDVAEYPAEIVLSFASGDEVISVQKTAPLTLHGRGALTWDAVERAAAFVTSTDPAVTAFTRSLLVAFEEQIQSLGPPGQHLMQALVLFEGLKQHGVRYLPDANTPYARVSTNQATVDHIQYPAQLLQSKAGDCDDLTVLYASLLENAGIATALVDYPGHIFLLFDTGLDWQASYQLPVEKRRYLPRGDRLWIPVEITRVGDSFHQAWQAGVDEIGTLSPMEQRRRIVETATAWQQYPATAPTLEVTAALPEPTTLAPAVTRAATTLQAMIDAYIEATYLDPLKVTPDNDFLRAQLLKVYLALGQADKAIETGETYLLDKRGNKVATYHRWRRKGVDTGEAR